MHRLLRHCLLLLLCLGGIRISAQNLYTVTDLGLYTGQDIYGPSTNTAGWEVSTFSSSFPYTSYSTVKRPGDSGFSALFGTAYFYLDAAYGINDKNMVAGAMNLFYSTNYAYRADANLVELIRLTDFSDKGSTGITNIERATRILDNGTIIGTGRTAGDAIHVVQLTPIATELSWDANGSTSGLPQGSGTWSHSSGNWTVNTAGTSASGWTDGAIAKFYYNNLPSTLTVTDNITLEGLWTGYTPNGMTIDASGGGLTFTGQGFIRTSGSPSFLKISAPIGGSAGLWITGNGGGVTLESANTYTGLTRIDYQNDLVVGHAGALGASGAGNETQVNSGGYLGFAISETTNETMILNGGGIYVVPDYGSSTLRQVDLAGPVVLQEHSALGGSRPDFNASMTVSGVISETGGARNLVVWGATLTGTNTFTGDAIAEGHGITVAQVTNAGVAGPLGQGTRLVLGENLEGPSRGNFHYTGASATTNREVALEGGGAIDVVQAGTTLTLSGLISGANGFEKTGAGILALTSANTFSGGTVVSEGLLRVNNPTGSGLGSGQVQVNSGGTLGGTGSIAGLTTIADGGHLAPGASPGTLTFTGGLTLEENAVLDFELGTLSDLIRVSGGTLSGPASGLVTLNLAAASGFGPATYILFDFNGASLSNFSVASFQLGSAPVGYEYGLALNGNTLELTASLAAVPEVSTAALCTGLLALGLAALRRKRASLQVTLCRKF